MTGLRVLHVVHHIYDYPCGYRTRSGYLLREQMRRGIVPLVLTSSDHEHGTRASDALGTWVVRHTPPHRGPDVPVLRQCQAMARLQRHVSMAIRDFCPDVVHAHSPVLVGAPALRAARQADVPFVYEVRDLWENASVDVGKFGLNSPPYRLARRLDTWVLRRADAVVAIGEHMRRELSSRGVPSERLFVVGNGVELSAVDVSDAMRIRARARFGLNGSPTIGYVGTFQPYEGLDLLIDAVPAIRAALPVRLLIAGDGREADALRRRAVERGVAQFVTFTGRIPHDQVAEVYAAADLMVYPRVLTPTTALTTPLKPLEAMAARTPVLASDVPALTELVSNGETGGLFRAGDVDDLVTQCIRFLRDSELRQRVATAAYEWVLASRQWDGQVARYAHVYETAMGGRMRSLACA